MNAVLETEKLRNMLEHTDEVVSEQMQKIKEILEEEIIE